MLRALMAKIGCKNVSIVSKEIEILGKTQKGILEIKNIVTEMKNAFSELISRLDVARRVSMNLMIYQ